MFSDIHRAQVVAGIGKNWTGKLELVSSPIPDGFFTSGGCLVVSRTPIASQHTTVFSNYSKPADYGLRADGYTAKGVLHTRVQRRADNTKDFVDVFYTSRSVGRRITTIAVCRDRRVSESAQQCQSPRITTWRPEYARCQRVSQRSAFTVLSVDGSTSELAFR